MPFQSDTELFADVEREFGQYVTSFVSDGGQVRADLFRRGGVVEAHVSFPTGLDASSVNDRYYSVLWNYARENGLSPDQFQIIYSDSISRI